MLDRLLPPKCSPSDRQGSVAVIAAVGMAAMIAMSAFALDLGTAYAKRSRLQSVADSAALAGAISWVKTLSAASVQATVQDLIIANGLTTSMIHSITLPTKSDPNVTLSLTSTSPLTLGQVFGRGNSVTVTGYSIASVKTATVPVCVLALTTLAVTGTLNANGCGVVSNALLTVALGGSLIGSSIDTTLVVLNVLGSVSPAVLTGTPAVVDPYSGTLAQALAGLVSGCMLYLGQSSLTPGCWLGVTVTSSLSLVAGTYYFPTLVTTSGSTITGTGGVTIVTAAQATLALNGTIAITAPTSGAWAGIAIDALSGVTANPGVTFNVNGAIYSPLGSITLANTTWTQTACTTLVALAIVSLTGSAVTLPQTNCSSYGYPKIFDTGGSTVALTQ